MKSSPIQSQSPAQVPKKSSRRTVKPADEDKSPGPSSARLAKKASRRGNKATNGEEKSPARALHKTSRRDTKGVDNEDQTPAKGSKRTARQDTKGADNDEKSAGQSPAKIAEKVSKRSVRAVNNEDQSSKRGRIKTARLHKRSVGSTRRRTASADKSIVDNDQQTAFSIALRDFALQTIQTGIDGIVKEFVDLKVADSAPPPVKIAFDANHDKNRYKDVYCKEETRVVLKWPPGSTNDYIHANWVSIQGEKKFICSQGPTEKTVDDFWRMIWENKCRAIVMLCNIMEKGKKKCELYYPEKPEDPAVTTSSNIVIKNIGAAALEKILTVSILEITIEGSEPFTVRHFFWNSWPDLGVPSNIMACLRLLARIKTLYPAVVHCSAGIGRTGTIVGLQMCQQTIMSGEPLSILKIVKELRACRHGAVQTDIQYVYMHRVMMGLADNMKAVTQDELAPFYEAYDAFLKSRGC
jgi:protein tyrosine phosphatase